MTKLLPRLSVLILFFFIFSSLIISVPVAISADESSSAAQKVATEEWDISADKIIRYENPESIVAEGNIVLVKRKKIPPKPPGSEDGDEGLTDWYILLEEAQPEVEEVTPENLETEQEPVYNIQATIKADWMAYDVALNTIKARGNVSVEADDQSIFAEQATVNLEQETGTFKKATILGNEKDLHLEGDVIEKTGFKTYHIENGWVITCKVPEGKKAPWSFAASDTVIKQDGYAILKHARFRIKDVPVFYSPWLMIPAKNKRETGFLLPELSTAENSGFGFNLPFFWNISDSTDMTIYTQYFVNRGYMPGVEFRYITDPNDKGLLMANYLHDELSDPSETDYYEDTGYTHDNKDRYWFRGKADQDFGSWTSRLDLDIVSDRDYLREFNTGSTGFQRSSDQFLETFGRSLENKTDDQRTNNFGIQRSWGSTSLEASFLGINDVRSDDAKFDADGNELPTPLWNLPTIDYTGTIPFENLWDLTLQWNTDYVNFWREEGIGGHRFDIYPTLSAPLPISPYLESRAEVGLRDTYYIVQEYGDAQWDESDSQNRLLYDLKAELGTTLMRTFAMSGKSMTGLNHQVRPYVEYEYLPDVDQDDLPKFDGVDTVGDENDLSYGLDNFFNALSNDNSDREYGWFKIKQSYSFLDDRSDEPFSDINVDLKWIPLTFLEFWYKTDYDVYDSIFALHDLEGSFRTKRGDIFRLEYYFKDNGEADETNQINAFIQAALFSGLSARFNFEHSIANDETNVANLSLLYQALCWSVELGSQYTPEETSFMLVFSLANLGSPLKLYY